VLGVPAPAARGAEEGRGGKEERGKGEEEAGGGGCCGRLGGEGGEET
jgi:hypothetical protein